MWYMKMNKINITQLNEQSRVKTKGFITWLEKAEIARQAEQKEFRCVDISCEP